MNSTTKEFWKNIAPIRGWDSPIAIERIFKMAGLRSNHMRTKMHRGTAPTEDEQRAILRQLRKALHTLSGVIECAEEK